MDKTEIPVFAKSWGDAETNKEYWWNRPLCANEGCEERALSYHDRCWGHLRGEERDNWRVKLLKKSDLKGLQLNKANFKDANLGGADLRRANLEGANLEFANLEGADLRRANLEGAHLEFANLEGASLRWTNLEGAYLFWATLEESDLYWANIKGGYLGLTNFEGAVLKWANLEGAYLWWANFKGADLSNAKFGRTGLIQKKTPIVSEEESSGDKQFLEDAKIEYKPVTNIIYITYNPHTRFYFYPFGFIKWGLKWAWNKLRRKEIPKTPIFAQYKKTRFIGVDTTDLDLSQHPQLIRDIQYQQFLYAFKNRKPKWFYRLAYWLWGTTSYFGESFLLWLFWMSLIVFGFGIVFSFYPHFILTQAEVFNNQFEPFYYSGLVFTSLGLGGLKLNSLWGQVLVLAEVMLGFIMLGSLVSFFANKFVRRD
ncbi:hypothetical protein ES703_92842 [subsurface metagenome]